MSRQIIEIEISTSDRQVFNLNWLIPKIVEILCSGTLKIKRIQIKEVNR